MKRKRLMIAGILLGMLLCTFGCGKKSQKTTGETVKAVEGIEETIKEDIPEIFYDFETEEIVNLGTKEMELAQIIDDAYCIKKVGKEGVLELNQKKDRQAPYLLLPAGTFDDISELTIAAKVKIKNSKKDSYLFLLESNQRYFSISLNKNSITTAFSVADNREEKIKTVVFSKKRTKQWIYVTITVKNSARDYIAETYIDGEFVGSLSFDGYALEDIGKEQECSIGKSKEGVSYFDGCIADFCVWFHAMEEAEIRELYEKKGKYI